MGEADAPVPHEHDVRTLGLVQRTPAVPGNGFDERDRRLCHRRCRRERAAGFGRQRFQPGAHELVERHRQPLTRLELDRALLERPRQLEGEERIAAGELVQAPEGRTWGQEPEPLLNEVLHGAQAQWR